MRAACLSVSVRRAWPGRAGTRTTVPPSRSCPNRQMAGAGVGDILQRGLRLREKLELVSSWYLERLGLTLSD